MEIWKDIKGYENLYQISNLGNVKSLGNGGSNASKEKFLKLTKDTCGYLQVGLCKQGKRKMCRVHRLVAENFIDNPNNYPMINHKDENKTNNNVENLEFCDVAYNNNYGTRNIRAAESCRNHPNRSKQVLCVDTSIIYPSVNEVQRELGFKSGNISSACNGKRKTCGGYTWRYV